MTTGSRQPRKANASLSVGGVGSAGRADKREPKKGSRSGKAGQAPKGAAKGGRGGARSNAKGKPRQASRDARRIEEAAPTNRLIIVGSPREGGRSMHLADLLFEACIEDCPTDEVALAPVATLSIAPCTGCDACAVRFDDVPADESFLSEDDPNAEEGAAEADPSSGISAAPCAIADDMAEVRDLIDAADELVVVCPVYFSGPPAQFKALLDRLQPYFWAAQEARQHDRVAYAAREKRPLVLHVVGEGDDPYGYAPLVSIVRSAFAAAGFALEAVFDWVGKIDAEGEIVAEADVIPAAEFDVSAPDARAFADAAAAFDASAFADDIDEATEGRI